MGPLSPDIIDAMIQCFGKCFYYKDAMESFLLAAGVHEDLNKHYRGEYKFVWARHLLRDLGKNEEGCVVQRRILTTLCYLRNLPDSSVKDKDAGLDALRNLKRMANEHDLIIKNEIRKRNYKQELRDKEAEIIRARKDKLKILHTRFSDALNILNRQEAGYTLESILKDLFGLFEIEYRKSYRTQTHQIDGSFYFEGFHYLVEAKWRKGKPTEREIEGFKSIVEKRLESTRGLFVSIMGFRDEVIAQFSGRENNIIFIDGIHLTKILEGRIDLKEALRILINKAAQEGIPYSHPF